MNSAKWLGMWLFNSLITILGVAVTIGLIIFSTRPLTTRAMRMYLLSPPYYPLPVTVGLLVGYFSYTRFKGSYRYWVWIAPAILVLVSLSLWKLANQASWLEAVIHFVGPLRFPEGSDQIGTAPLFYMSMSYSLGALIQSKLRNWMRSHHEFHSENCGS